MPTVELLQVVDQISASPTVLLDLNDTVTRGAWYLRGGASPDFSPPPLRRSVAQSMLVDGGQVSSAAYDNRTIVLPLRLEAPNKTTFEAEKNAAMATLGRLFDASLRILKWQARTAAAPTFYRVLRSPSFDIVRWDPTDGVLDVDVELLAEPFGIGLSTTTTPVTVTNNPATSPNGCYFDVPGVTGDVETPMVIKAVPTDTTIGHSLIFTTRRRGTPTNLNVFRQAETAGMLVDAAFLGSASGFANGQGARISYATNAAMDIRLQFTTIPYSAGIFPVDARGIYRMFAAVRPTSASAQHVIHGATPAAAMDPVNVPQTTSRVLMDLGLFQVPPGQDLIGTGYDAALSFTATSVFLYSARTSGSGSLDVDWVGALPADAEYLRTSTSFQRVVLDGVQDAGYLVDSTGAVTNTAAGPLGRVGTIPMLSPQANNRVYLLRPEDSDTSIDSISDAMTVTVTWWPRYLVAAP